MKLSYEDRKLIFEERVLRKAEEHTEPQEYPFTRPNEYLNFMTKCFTHAYYSEEYELFRLIGREVSSWEEVD